LRAARGSGAGRDGGDEAGKPLCDLAEVADDEFDQRQQHLEAARRGGVAEAVKDGGEALGRGGR